MLFRCKAWTSIVSFCIIYSLFNAFFIF